MKITVVSPHRDDAAFSLGLAVGTWLQKGHAVEVLNVFTRSEYAPYSDAESLHPNDRMSFASAVRKREDEAWVKLYIGQRLPEVPPARRGKLTLNDLNLKDAPLRLHCDASEVYQRGPDMSEKVMSKLKRALELGRADALVLPLGVGRHVDHLTVRAACLPADPHTTPLAFYEDLPYTAQLTATTELDDAVQSASLAVGVPLNVAFAAEAADADAAVAHKLKYALCYDSQIDDATALQIAAFSRRYEGRERLWANAAWAKLVT